MLADNGIRKIRFKNVQALRAVAALLVCGYHFRIAIWDEPWAHTAFDTGWIGVQIFFMISGFIMVHTTSTIHDNFAANAGKFILNRLIRIVPLYYLCTFLMIADDLNDGYLFTNGITLLKSLLFITPFTANIGPEYGFPSLAVGWTLNYEMTFYTLFAISLLAGKMRYYFMFAVFLVVVLLIPIISGFGFSTDYYVYRNYSVEFLNMFSNPIWVHFIFGVSIGLILPKIQVGKLFSRLSLPVSIVFFILYYTNATGIGFNAIYDLFFCGLLLTSFLLNDVHKEGLKLPASLAALGDRSYSIYLLHPIIFSYLQILFYKTGMRPATLTLFFFLLALVVTIGVASLFYKFVELKTTLGLKRLVFQRGEEKK